MSNENKNFRTNSENAAERVERMNGCFDKFIIPALIVLVLLIVLSSAAVRSCASCSAGLVGSSDFSKYYESGTSQASTADASASDAE